jgi:aconitate hydratase
MGIIPLQFKEGDDADSLGLSGEETFDIIGVKALLDNYKPASHITVRAKSPDGKTKEFKATLRIDTPQEVLYYKHGGILQYVLRQLLSAKKGVPA